MSQFQNLRTLTAEEYYRLTLQRVQSAIDGAISAIMPVMDETPAGVIDGINLDFTTAQAFSKLFVYYNGQRLCNTDDFTVTGANSFTLLSPPHPEDKLRVDYVLA